MDTQLLSIFADCVRKKSFAAVARDRNIDPSRVTRAIAQLENELSIKLFQRSTRQVAPTEAGLLYFERIEPLIEALNDAKLLATDSQRKPSGLLRISAPVSFAELHITPWLAEFSTRYPDIRFEYHLTDTDLDMIANQLDVSVRVGPLQDSRLIATKLYDMDTRLIASPRYLKDRGQPNNINELRKHRCLILGYRGFDKNNWTFKQPGHRKKTLEVPAHLSTSNAMALKQCALAGMGIALLATWMIRQELEEGCLIELFPAIKVSSAQGHAAAWALYPSRQYMPRKTRAFIDFLKSKLHSQP